MILQDKKMNTYTRYVSEFKGLNRLPVADDGELAESKNMVFDFYPVMSVRRCRSIDHEYGGVPSALLRKDDDVYAVIDGALYVNAKKTALTDLSEGEKSIVEFWGKVFVFPDKRFYDLATEEAGSMGNGTFPESGSVPDMDHVCVHNNRIWGVKGNYIYASANGWAMGGDSPAGIQGWVPGYDDAGYPNDLGACWFEVASDGDFRAVSSWDDKIVALKSNCHHEITGSYPSNFSLSTVSKCGTRFPSSVCEVDGKLLFVSDRGVQSYGGSFENDISRELNEQWDTAHIYGAGTDGVRYYLSGKFGDEDKLYVYNSFLGSWTEEDSVGFRYFSNSVGVLNAIDENGSVYRIGTNDDEEINWSFSFSDYEDTIYRQSRPVVLTFKVKGEKGTSFDVEMKSDRNRSFKRINRVNIENESLVDVKCPLHRGGEHVFRVSGKGYIQFYGYQLKVQDGGESNA